MLAQPLSLGRGASGDGDDAWYGAEGALRITPGDYREGSFEGESVWRLLWV